MDNYSQINYPIITKAEHKASRSKKASILDYHSIFLSHGHTATNSLHLISDQRIFQDKVSQEFIETLYGSHEKQDVREYLDKYSKLILEDLEIYYFIVDDPAKVAKYLRDKNTYSEPKQLIAKIHFLSYKGYRAEDIFTIINATEKNPEIVKALNIREANGQLSTTMFSTVLPQHIGTILESMLLNSVSLKELDKLLELDF